MMSIAEGVAFLKPTGHPVSDTTLTRLLTREEEARGEKITMRIRGRLHAPASDIAKVHRDWVVRSNR
jgi:hypothetical protein